MWNTGAHLGAWPVRRILQEAGQVSPVAAVRGQWRAACGPAVAVCFSQRPPPAQRMRDLHPRFEMHYPVEHTAVPEQHELASGKSGSVMARTLLVFE